MKLTEAEMRMVFQIESTNQNAALNEIYMTWRYAPNPATKETAEGLLDKLRPLSDQECMDLIRKVQAEYRLPEKARTIGEMLAEAMEKRVESGHDILYLLQDMQEFELYGTVRAVVSVCDSLNYITEEEELEHVFALVNNYLDPQGIFLFDMNTVYKYQTMIGNTTIAENRDEGSFIWENSYDRENALNVYELALFLPREDGLYEKCEEEHVQKAYSIEAIKAMIVKAGMELVAVYDAYTHNPGDENCERLTFVAREHGKSAQNGYHGRIPEKPETHRAD